MKRPSKILLIFICIFLNYSTLIAQASAGKLIDKVIASVDDQPILQSELEIEYQLYQAQGTVGKIPTRLQILESIIINKIILANATKKGIHTKKEEVDQYFKHRMQVILKDVASEAQLEQYIGKPIEVFKQELRKSIKEQLTIDKIRNTITEDISMSPTDTRTFFKQLPPKDIPFYSASVEAYQLVRYPHVSEQEKKAVIEKLEALKARIQAGEDFTTLAKQYSEDTGTASEGGNLGFWRIGELDPAYEKAALALRPGEISEPIETKFGLHIIQLIERRKGEYNTRHILLKPVAAESDLKDTMVQLNSIRTTILEKKTTFEKAAIIYSDDIATAQQGGLLTNSNEGIQMPVDKLPPDLFFILDQMPPGTISEPITFISSTGKQGARIIYLKEKIPSHRANFEQDYERIYKLALTIKKQNALDEWIKSAKEKAIIQLDPAYESCNIL